MVQHEFSRPTPADGIMADVYDSPEWKSFMGPPTYPNKRLGFQFCADAVPAFAKEGGVSLKPISLMNLSLSPTERGKAENMLLWMVISTAIKNPGVQKYFNFASNYELKDLWTTGVDGVKAKIFGTSMDTPGRSELLGGDVSGVHIIYCRCVIIFTHTHHRNEEQSRLPGMLCVSAYLECWRHCWSNQMCQRWV